MNFLKGIKNLAKRAWNGKEKLWIIFWVYFVAVTLLFYLNVIYKFVPIILNSSILGSPNDSLELCVKFIFISALTFSLRMLQVILIWRCAFNCSWKIFGYIVRVLVSLLTVSIAYRVVGDVQALIQLI
jgi:hypothetical protein